MKILIVTVGGSPQPIITAVQSLKPDRVIFICTEGPKGSKSQVIDPGNPCQIFRGGKLEKELPNLPTILNLGSRFDASCDLVLINNPDNPSECYRVVMLTIKNLLKDHPASDIMADYTGGTKTMSLALGMVSMDYGIRLYLTTAISRTNLKGVEKGETTKWVSTSFIDVERKIEQYLTVFLRQHNYSAAISNLSNILTAFPLSPESDERVHNWLNFCKALEAWDRFDYDDAWNLLGSFMHIPAITQLGLFLKHVMQSRADIDPNYLPAMKLIRGHGYELVEDLLLNAERRAVQNRYDDAVGRLYRALELLSQIRLSQKYGIKTGDVPLDRIPDDLKETYEKKRGTDQRIRIGLRESYDLLTHFPNDPLGLLYRQYSNAILSCLEIRNNSLFAHGFSPIAIDEYDQFKRIVIPFIKTAINQMTTPKSEPPQFPCHLILEDW